MKYNLTDTICAVFLGLALLASIFEGTNEISAPINPVTMGYMGRDLVYHYQVKKEDEKESEKK